MEQQQTGSPGYDIPCYDLPISPPSYSGRSGGPGYDIPWYDLPMSPPSYSPRGTIYLCRLRHTAVATVAPAMISRAPRRSTVVVFAIVRNRSYDATAAATVQHCRRSSSQPHAPSLALSGTKVTTAATVQRHSSSQPHAPPLALSGTRGTTAATVQRRRSSQPHASSLALSGTRGTTAAIVQHRNSSNAPAPSVALAGSRGALAAMDRR